MAESRETVILDVQLDAGKVSEDLSQMVTRIAALKKQQSDLTKEIKAGNDTNGKYAEQLIKVKDQLTWCEKQAKGLSATSKLLTADTLTYADSLNGERQKLADMQKAYDQLDATMRKSEGGKAFLQAIKDQSDAVKELEGETGRFQRNVGNYPQLLGGLIPGFGKVTGAIDKMKAAAAATPQMFQQMAMGIGTATKAAMKFIATPIGAIIAAIVAALAILKAAWDKISDAIAKNDDASTAIARLYSVTVQPVIDAVTKAFAVLADWIGKVAGALADFLGGTEDAAKGAQELVVATDRLQEAERQYTISSAKNSAEIAKLRDQATQKDKYTAAERRKFIEEAIRLETENLEAQKNNLAERLRIMEETAKREKDTSDETKDKIAQARADMYKAEEAYYSGTRRLNAQLVAFDQEEAAAKKAAADAAKKAAEEKKKEEEEATKAQEAEQKKREELARQQAATLAAIEEKQRDLAVSLIGDEGTKAVEMRKLQGEREIAQLQKQLETDETLTAESREKLNELIKQKQQALNAELLKMSEDYAKRKVLEEQTAELTTAQNIVELKKQVAKEGSAELMQLQLQALELQKQQELMKYAEGSEERLLIDEQYEQAKAELEEQYRQAKTEAELEMAQQALQSVQNLNSAISDIENVELSRYKQDQEEKKKALKKRLDAGAISQEQYNEEVQRLDEETHKKEVELQREQAKREKAMAIFSAVISTAAAIIGFLANPSGWAGVALAAMAGITGAAQIAAIAAQPLPEYASGTALVNDGTGRGYSAGDVVPAMLSNDEMVLNPNQYTNIAKGLFDFANNPNQYSSGIDYELLGETTANAVAELPAPVMVYSEYEDFKQRKATYDELAKI